MSPATTDEDVLRLHEAGLDAQAIAARLFVSERTVYRYLDRVAPERKKRRALGAMSDDVKARMTTLLRDGLPSSWIGEDVGLAESTVNNFRQSIDSASGGEWKKTCLSIRRNPELRALHEEFHPK